MNLSSDYKNEIEFIFSNLGDLGLIFSDAWIGNGVRIKDSFSKIDSTGLANRLDDLEQINNVLFIRVKNSGFEYNQTFINELNITIDHFINYSRLKLESIHVGGPNQYWSNDLKYLSQLLSYWQREYKQITLIDVTYIDFMFKTNN